MSENSGIRAVVFDVDGTLFDYGNNCVPASAIEAIQRLKAEGYLIIVATGRTKTMLGPQVTEQIAPDYYILANGTLITDRHGVILYSSPFLREDTELLVRLVGEYHGAMMLKYPEKNCIYYHYEQGKMLWDIGPGLDEANTYFDEKRKSHSRKLPVGISVYCNDYLKQELQDHFQLDYFKDGYGVDVIKTGTHKMKALDKLLKKLRLDSRHMLAFGDSSNDMEMIRKAGIGVAMGNGKEELKAIADFVAPCSWEDGIAQSLIKLNMI